MDYLNLINTKYPIRRTKEEKEKFRNYVIEEVNKGNYKANVEINDNHNNVIIGDINNAKVIFTAHYDTPATSIIPNLMLPRNVFIGMVYQLGIPILLSILSLVVAYLISNFIETELSFTVVLYLILYLSSFYLLTRCFKNKNNKNDNTSGVATVLSIVSKCQRNDVAFVLFDDEEKGLLGSKAFNRKYKEVLNDKLIINFDCVGVGNNIIFIAKPGAELHPLYKMLNQNFKSNNDYNVLFYPMKGSLSNSDYKNFYNGIGVMACKKKKNIYYTSKIHTNKDQEASIKNIEFIVNNIMNFIEAEV